MLVSCTSAVPEEDEVTPQVQEGVVGQEDEGAPIEVEEEETIPPKDEEIATAEEEAVQSEEEDVILTPNIIFLNGQVITMEPDLPQAEALAVFGEDILAIGSNDEIQALSGPETQVIDLDGRALLPRIHRPAQPYPN